MQMMCFFVKSPRSGEKKIKNQKYNFDPPYPPSRNLAEIEVKCRFLAESKSDPLSPIPPCLELSGNNVEPQKFTGM